MSCQITHVAFDADDTLWHSEGHYRDAQAAYEELLGAYIDVADANVHARLLEVERRNIRRFGLLDTTEEAPASFATAGRN
mgnify:CR=1 FL=1